MTSPTGSVLATDVIYPRFGKEIYPHNDPNAIKLKDLLNKYRYAILHYLNFCSECLYWMLMLRERKREGGRGREMFQPH